MGGAGIQNGMEAVQVEAFIAETSRRIEREISKGVTNVPDGTVSSKTKQSVTLISQGVSQLQEMLQTVNPAYIACVNIESCLTIQVVHT